ncbi:hypothetical protein HELRODRAFT_177771 [Helobdella robusta]|uniref:Uncharacterized protein n=1 Tax=Helobdella robusta TaxID=6412 RepID=T1FC84_HELRO|nr:hypothetical protein HELRODRAFT_177771 [Helobdella robusta]ESN97712.1 hypothetical protein HELRODRAFT_177771 [Helobdella robusta]
MDEPLICHCMELLFAWGQSDVSNIDGTGKYKEYNFCLNDDVESDKAYCRAGVCTPGWRGSSCRDIDCTVLRGNCPPDMICKTAKYGKNLTVSDCACQDGYMNASACATTRQMSSELNGTSQFVIMLCWLIFTNGIIFTLIFAASKIKKIHPHCGQEGGQYDHS